MPCEEVKAVDTKKKGVSSVRGGEKVKKGGTFSYPPEK